ncbi:alpha/beta fold hydrolase [uncultured Victivallis sp.]|uniref:esterase/lipase family protein n=1 Tax=uncultured Victivallis sp. TaxID=354118 RepID=UPI0025F32E0C|nr:alpha/beta fold hydrolase [uncultured Victivallis sp.]
MIRSLARYAAGLRHIEFLPGEPGRIPVILVHGLLHRGIVMKQFALWLNRQGRPVVVYDYRTTRRHIVEHGRELADFLCRREMPQIDLVTHSMGGLLARVALAELAATGRGGMVHRIVMLAPPHHGSAVATAWVEHFAPSPFLVRPLPDLADRPEAAVHDLPVPEGYEIGIIAGRFDNKVSLSSTHLRGERAHVVIDSGHAFIMNRPEARHLTLRFLETGSFDKN